jgi:hypothetical protein
MVLNSCNTYTAFAVMLYRPAQLFLEEHMSVKDRGPLYGLFHPDAATNDRGSVLNRAFFECPECDEQWTFDCNLIDYFATCPKCGARNIQPYYVEEIESGDHEIC